MCTHAPGVAAVHIPEGSGATTLAAVIVLIGGLMLGGKPPGVVSGVQSIERPEPSKDWVTKLLPTQGLICRTSGVGRAFASVSPTTGLGSTKERGRPFPGVEGKSYGICSGSTVNEIYFNTPDIVFRRRTDLKCLGCVQVSLRLASSHGAPSKC